MSYIVKSDFIDDDDTFYKQGAKYPEIEVEIEEISDERLDLLTGKGGTFAYIALDGNQEPTQEELLKKFYKKTSADSMKEILVSHEIEFDESADKQALFDLILEKEIDVLAK